MSWTMEKPVMSALVRHLGARPFAILGASFEPVLRGAAVILQLAHAIKHVPGAAAERFGAGLCLAKAAAHSGF